MLGTALAATQGLLWVYIAILHSHIPVRAAQEIVMDQQGFLRTECALPSADQHCELVATVGHRPGHEAAWLRTESGAWLGANDSKVRHFADGLDAVRADTANELMVQRIGAYTVHGLAPVTPPIGDRGGSGGGSSGGSGSSSCRGGSGGSLSSSSGGGASSGGSGGGGGASGSGGGGGGAAGGAAASGGHAGGRGTQSPGRKPISSAVWADIPVRHGAAGRQAAARAPRAPSPELRNPFEVGPTECAQPLRVTDVSAWHRAAADGCHSHAATLADAGAWSRAEGG